MSSIIGAKAIGLVHRGEILEDTYARVFRVQGSKPGTVWVVTITKGDRLCNCPAGVQRRACSHVGAASLMMARAREHRARANAQAGVEVLPVVHNPSRDQRVADGIAGP